MISVFVGIFPVPKFSIPIKAGVTCVYSLCPFQVTSKLLKDADIDCRDGNGVSFNFKNFFAEVISLFC